MFHWEQLSLRIYMPVYGLRLPGSMQLDTYAFTKHKEGKCYEIHFR